MVIGWQVQLICTVAPYTGLYVACSMFVLGGCDGYLERSATRPRRIPLWCGVARAADMYNSVGAELGCSVVDHSTTACHFCAAALATADADRPHVGEVRILEAWDAGGDDAAYGCVSGPPRWATWPAGL